MLVFVSMFECMYVWCNYKTQVALEPKSNHEVKHFDNDLRLLIWSKMIKLTQVIDLKNNLEKMNETI